jgi:hypothetical protein
MPIALDNECLPWFCLCSLAYNDDLDRSFRPTSSLRCNGWTVISFFLVLITTGRRLIVSLHPAFDA